MTKDQKNPRPIEPSIASMGDLRRQLLQVFDEVRNGEMKHFVAKELTNTAGKVINSLKVELEYAALRRETPYIPFLGGAVESAPSRLPDRHTAALAGGNGELAPSR